MSDCEIEFTMWSCHTAHEMADFPQSEWKEKYQELTKDFTFDEVKFKRHTWKLLKEILSNEYN